jgi:glucuronokinase
MFGDSALGETNLAMIAVARSVGAAAKFTGSGGAIVALCPNGVQQEEQLQGEGRVRKLLVLSSC